MHYHITRNGEVPSWAWTAKTRAAAAALARQFRRGRSGRPGDTFDTLRCAEPLCPDFREWLDSQG